MISWFGAILASRSPRERWLLALMVFIVIPVGFAGLVVFPLLDQRASARGALDEALATRDWYQARQSEIAGLQAPADVPNAVAVAPIGLGGIEDSLIAADLRDQVGLLANAQGDAVTLSLQEVPFEALMAWVDQINVTGGYRLAALQITRSEVAGFVDAQLRWVPGT